MSESGPIWRFTEPAPPYPDGRFDGPTHGFPTYPGTVDRSAGPAAYPGDLPPQPYKVADTSHLTAIGRMTQPDRFVAIGYQSGPYQAPPLDPQQPTPQGAHSLTLRRCSDFGATGATASIHWTS